jgi:hypothetical protein
MYYPGQIVWSDKHSKPIKDNGSKDTRPFIDSGGKVICPTSVAHANLLLSRRRITPAPIHDRLCWSCGYSLDIAPREACKATDEHARCAECNAFNIYTRRLGKSICRTCSNSLDKNGLRLVAEELIKEIDLIKHAHDEHGQKVSELISHLVELDDPGGIKRDGRMRDELEKMVREHRFRGQ